MAEDPGDEITLGTRVEVTQCMLMFVDVVVSTRAKIKLIRPYIIGCVPFDESKNGCLIW